jgi:hypothetical protein
MGEQTQRGARDRERERKREKREREREERYLQVVSKIAFIRF